MDDKTTASQNAPEHEETSSQPSTNMPPVGAATSNEDDTIPSESVACQKPAARRIALPIIHRPRRDEEDEEDESIASTVEAAPRNAIQESNSLQNGQSLANRAEGSAFIGMTGHPGVPQQVPYQYPMYNTQYNGTQWTANQYAWPNVYGNGYGSWPAYQVHPNVLPVQNTTQAPAVTFNQGYQSTNGFQPHVQPNDITMASQLPTNQDQSNANDSTQVHVSPHVTWPNQGSGPANQSAATPPGNVMQMPPFQPQYQVQLSHHYPTMEGAANQYAMMPNQGGPTNQTATGFIANACHPGNMAQDLNQAQPSFQYRPTTDAASQQAMTSNQGSDTFNQPAFGYAVEEQPGNSTQNWHQGQQSDQHAAAPFVNNAHQAMPILGNELVNQTAACFASPAAHPGNMTQQVQQSVQYAAAPRDANAITPSPNVAPPNHISNNFATYIMQHGNVPHQTQQNTQYVAAPMAPNEHAMTDDQDGEPTNQARYRIELDRKWTERYQQLLEYRATNGNCDVPQRYKPNQSLGRWVKDQRSYMNKGKLREDRRRLLDAIGFSWQLGRRSNEV